MNFKLRTGIIMLLTLAMVSCVSYRNNYGRKRFICCKFAMKPNTDNEAYKIIDTTKVYKLISVLNIEGNDSTYLKEMNKIFLKFYTDGKVGEFYNYDSISINSLNPKKATIGIYRYSKGELTIQTYLETPQGNGFIKSRLKKSTVGFLEFENENYTRRYEKIDIPKEFLIYKPDW